MIEGKWILLGIGGPSDGREFVLLGDKVQLGRTPDNDIQVQDKNVSRHHAVIGVREEGCWIKDLESKNGIFVNDEKVTEQSLSENDVIRLGECRFKLTREGGTEQHIETSKYALGGVKEVLQQRFYYVGSRLRQMGTRRLLLYGGGASVLLIMGMMALFKADPEPPSLVPTSELTTPIAPLAKTPPKPIDASEEEVLSWKSRSQVALQRDDLLAAIPLLKKVVAARADDMQAQAQLTRAEGRLSSLITHYYETGAQEYEKLYFEQAIAEWRKVMALAKDFDAEAYQKAKEKIREAEVQIQAKR